MLLIANTFPASAEKKKVEIIEDAIRDGARTLRAISNATAMSYRDVNAQVTSLTKQMRVVVTNPKAVRKDQEFEVNASRPSRRCRYSDTPPAPPSLADLPEDNPYSGFPTWLQARKAALSSAVVKGVRTNCPP